MKVRYIGFAVVLATLATSCGITTHLPEGEVLYGGVSEITRHTEQPVDASIDESLTTLLEILPTNAFLGSAYHISPFPFGLWIYNGLYPKKEKGFRHWLWQHFKSDPLFISGINPEMRADAAMASLRDEGYFSASVIPTVQVNANDSLRAKVGYDITYRDCSRLGRIEYITGRHPRLDSIVRHTLDATCLHTGDRFSTTSLDNERSRLVSTLQDSGYYYFKSEYIKILADSTRQPSTVDLRFLIGVGADVRAASPCTLDSVHFTLDYGAGLKSKNHDTLRFLTVGYNGKQLVKTRTLRRSLGFRQHALYSPSRINLVKTRLGRLNTFKYSTTDFTVLRAASPDIPNDTTSLRLNVGATYNTLWSGTTKIGCIYKEASNQDKVGPGIKLSATRRNLFGSGESLTFEAYGSYEWNTSAYDYSASGYNDEAVDLSKLSGNSYELGLKASLSVPRLQIPRFFRTDREKPVTTSYSLFANWQRLSHYYQMTHFGGEIMYNFSLRNSPNTFSVSPIRLSYVAYDRSDLINQYKYSTSFEHAMEDQFIPQIVLSWTYDDGTVSKAHPVGKYFNLTLSEAGGLCDVWMGWVGSHRTQGERRLFNQPFSQFLKATAEFRRTQRLNSTLTLASRLMGGVGYAYGNSSTMPYSERFYVGGPNSLRGFSVRGVGPGGNTYYTTSNDPYKYINQVGDVKVEGNVELRFPIMGSIYGALFADAGNVWYLHDNYATARQNYLNELAASGQTTDNTSSVVYNFEQNQQIDSQFFKQLALDCGFGLRLDLDMLVLRFDIGVPLHNPNDTSTSYFNCRHGFLKQLNYNLAVGYPF